MADKIRGLTVEISADASQFTYKVNKHLTNPRFLV